MRGSAIVHKIIGSTCMYTYVYASKVNLKWRTHERTEEEPSHLVYYGTIELMIIVGEEWVHWTTQSFPSSTAPSSSR